MNRISSIIPEEELELHTSHKKNPDLLTNIDNNAVRISELL
jgi:hypothetical protein